MSEKRHFQRFLSQKVQGRKPLFSVPFLCISAGVGAYLPPLTPFTTIPCLGTLPPIVGLPSSFLNRLHGHYLFLSEGTELSSRAAA